MSKLEIASFNTRSAISARQHGADRIELCANASVGGTTPLLSDIQLLKGQFDVPINVMLRPRGGDFVYTVEEFRIMTEVLSSLLASPQPPDGFVFGFLTSERLVDAERCGLLIAQAQGRPCTFHRAFDEIVEEEMVEQLEVLVNLGFNAVLTSGGRKSALEGKEALKRLVEAANGRIDIIVGGGVRSANVGELRAATGATWFHSSAIIDSKSEDASPEEVEALGKAIRV